MTAGSRGVALLTPVYLPLISHQEALDLGRSIDGVASVMRQKGIDLSWSIATSADHSPQEIFDDLSLVFPNLNISITASADDLFSTSKTALLDLALKDVPDSHLAFPVDLGVTLKRESVGPFDYFIEQQHYRWGAARTLFAQGEPINRRGLQAVTPIMSGDLIPGLNTPLHAFGAYFAKAGFIRDFGGFSVGNSWFPECASSGMWAQIMRRHDGVFYDFTALLDRRSCGRTPPQPLTLASYGGYA